MVADMSRILFGLLALLLVACDRHETVISQNFDLCLNAKNIDFDLESGIDTQRGVMRRGANSVKFHIYSSVDSTWRDDARSADPNDRLTLLGSQAAAGMHKNTYVYKQGSDYVFVDLEFSDDIPSSKFASELESSLRACE